MFNFILISKKYFIASSAMAVFFVGQVQAEPNAINQSSAASATIPTPSSSNLAAVMTESQERAAYRGCEGGYYTGPRPGKSHYTKEHFVWAVTPEFAKKFCMPPEFISTSLHGAEAVAYKMTLNDDETLCSIAGGVEKCFRGSDHRFEIYYKKGLIPKVREGRYQHLALLPSRMMIAYGPGALKKELERTEKNPVVGAASLFSSGQFGLEGVSEKNDAWSMGAVYPKIYYEDVFEGVDFMAVEGGSGFTNLPSWKREKILKLVISVKQPWLGKGPQPQLRAYSAPPPKISEYFHVIELPTSMVEQIVKNDQARGVDAVGFAKQVFGVPAGK